MATVMATFTVPDFEQWKISYEAQVDPRQAAGWISSKIFRGDRNPNEVTLIHEWDSNEKFEAFSNHPVLLEMLSKNGIGAMRCYTLNKVNS